MQLFHLFNYLLICREYARVEWEMSQSRAQNPPPTFPDDSPASPTESSVHDFNPRSDLTRSKRTRPPHIQARCRQERSSATNRSTHWVCWRRPRHTLKGRQTASEVDRIGLRLQLRKRQAEAGDIVLLYGDESEALTHPYLARAWAKSGADLRVPAPGQAKKVAILGSLDHVTRQLIVHTSTTKRSTDFVAHLERTI